MRLLQRIVSGRKEFTEPPFWSLDGMRSPLLSTPWAAKDERIENDFEGYVQKAYRENGIVFAVILTRQLIFSEARFQWREFNNGRPGDLFGSKSLELLEKPWPGGTTGELLTRMESDASLAGNFFATIADDAGRLGRSATGRGRRIVRMRPDWVTIVSGSVAAPDDPWALDRKVIGYLYHPYRTGMVGDRPELKPTLLMPNEVCHYSPIPDPSARWRGMSWLTPILRDIEGDKAATVHKSRFFRNAATPNLTVAIDKDVKPEHFERFVELFEEKHKGAENAYKTVFLGGGADIKPLTFDFKQLELKSTQGAMETRIAAGGGVPPIIVGLSEGLASATYSNYGQARRRLADGTMRPLWRMASASLETLVDRPKPEASLWWDGRDIAFLREDQTDAAQIASTEAQTIRTLVDAGYEADSVIKALAANDWSLLRHSGLFSVQLQPPGATAPEPPPDPAGPPVEPPADPDHQNPAA